MLLSGSAQSCSINLPPPGGICLWAKKSALAAPVFMENIISTNQAFPWQYPRRTIVSARSGYSTGLLTFLPYMDWVRTQSRIGMWAIYKLTMN